MVNRTSLLRISGFALALAVLPQPLYAQQRGEVVQPLPTQAENDLRAALRRLAGDPRDLDALRMAGFAALDLNDTEAAQGFFARAQVLSRSDPRTLLGQAVIAVREEDPYQALAQFDRAEAGGASLGKYWGDRGLAYDLVGDVDRAKQCYRAALAEGDDPVVARRLAISQAISGDIAGAEATLLPLLQGGDRPAFRTRAFALAIVGRYDEAMAIVQVLQPPAAALQLAPFLRQLPNLLPAQQAAAANFGHFPRNIAVVTPASPARPSGGSVIASVTARPQAAARLEPQGEPLGPAVAAASEPTPSELPPTVSVQSAPEEVVQAATAPAQEPSAEPVEVVTVEVKPTAIEAAQETSTDAQVEAVLAQIEETVVVGPVEVEDNTARPAIDVVRAGPDPVVPAATPQIVTVDIAASTPSESPGANASPIPSESAPVTMDDAFGSFRLPTEGAAPTAGAVDITAIKPTREVRPTPAPEPAPAPAKPAQPARYWVQVATGQDRDALQFDWRRIRRAGGELLEGRTGYLASWGETNRLVTGPFETAAQANKMVSDLKEVTVDSFRFRSADGEVVERLP